MAMTNARMHIRVGQTSRGRSWLLAWVMTAVVVLFAAGPVDAQRVKDIARLAGHGESRLEGIGLVTGLRGTGDKAKDAIVTAKALAESMRHAGLFVDSLEDLTAGAGVALVMVYCHVPKEGAKTNDKLDVLVSATGNGGATSLEGGTLHFVPLFGPLAGQNQVWAIAQGRLSVDEDHPLSATVRLGAQMVRDLDMDVLESGGATLRLILQPAHAGFENAELIAGAINNDLGDEGEILARTIDAKSVLVRIPSAQRENHATFIANVMDVYIPLSLIRHPARVTINEAEGTITVSGDVRIKPTVVSYEGLSITTITPPPIATPTNPLVDTNRMFSVSTELARSEEEATRLTDLLTALQTLDVPIEGQIAIIQSLSDNGSLIGELQIKN
ncbi:MAG: flagellar basal body P-ring protein FlgI [Phycisphaerales bacterium]|nr:flagellar basal body P-ring protein FlgI [Phycisphaerales bacterium]